MAHTHAPNFSQPTSTPRRLGLALLIAMVISAVVTAIALIWQWPLAWAPAALVAIIFAVYAASSTIDWRVRQERRLPRMPAKERKQVIDNAEGRVGLKTMITIGAALFAIAVVLASAVFDWRVVGVGALAFFLLLVFFGLPVWIAVIQEEVGAEHQNLTGTPTAVQRSPASSTLGGPAISPPTGST